MFTLLLLAAGGVAGEREEGYTVGGWYCCCLQGHLGELLPGAAGDVILVDGDPLQDISCLTKAACIPLVIKDGLLAKVAVGEDGAKDAAAQQQLPPGETCIRMLGCRAGDCLQHPVPAPALLWCLV